MTDADRTLVLEQQHLTYARECLAGMYSDTAALTDAGAANALTAESLGRLRATRLRELEQASAAPPFFGRLNFAAGQGTGMTAAGSGAHVKENLHIGRRHVRDQSGDPVVVDWRAPISLAFYRATTADPHGVEVRRRFGFRGSELTSFEDENLADGVDPLSSTILRQEIERPRVGPMRDIVATIAPEQDELVRAPLETDVCVQGAPGTGKTAVGLHRAAYLLYTYAERLKRSKVLVVGPNASFLSYIGEVLPALGEFDVDQASIDSLTAGGVKVRALDTPEVARLKGDARWADVLQRALAALISKPQESLPVPLAGRTFRIDVGDVRRLVDDLRRSDYSYSVARDRLALGLAEHARRRAETSGLEVTDAHVRKAAKSAAVQTALDDIWPKMSGIDLVFRLLTDADALAHAALGVFSAEEQRTVAWPGDMPRRLAKFSLGDAVLADEAACLLERPTPYGHVILDEAQDLSPMQCRAVARRAVGGSFTILGDIAQGTSDWAAGSWADTLHHLGRQGAHIEALTMGYRVPGEVIDYANRLLPTIAPELPMSGSVRPGVGSLQFVATEPKHVDADVVQAVTDAREMPGTTGVICADREVARLLTLLRTHGLPATQLDDALPDGVTHRLDVVPATMAKGLEFDHVVVLEPADIVDAEAQGLRRLYVCLTRAVTSLRVVHARDIPVPDAAA